MAIIVVIIIVVIGVVLTAYWFQLSLSFPPLTLPYPNLIPTSKMITIIARDDNMAIIMGAHTIAISESIKDK